MSIKIEVTGESLTEVADKLLAIGNSLRVTVSYAEDNANREALQASRKGKTPSKKEPVADVGEQEAQSSVTEPTTTEPQSDKTPSTPVTSTLDFDKDVAPVVIGFVQSKGKPFVVGVLEQFGVAKASDLPEDRWGELLAALGE